ncbi:hypothetical protein MD588_24195 [Photobacterium sp. SDRW27]|uniref:hypothetical protein n=1 Tax=Photobacterium obscurum TaxID=2829490 RepID=UPI0022446A7E|nr:hypothetical protein [Photobacterium obscurum]MCW8331905.1 hypothetical protein [Photobacterium obscurum]
MPVSAFVDLLRRRAEDRRRQREARRYGVTAGWDKAEKHSEMFLTVPEITGKGTVTGYRAFFTRNMMPEDKRTLWDTL